MTLYWLTNLVSYSKQGLKEVKEFLLSIRKKVADIEKKMWVTLNMIRKGKYIFFFAEKKKKKGKRGISPIKWDQQTQEDKNDSKSQSTHCHFVHDNSYFMLCYRTLRFSLCCYRSIEY